MTTVNFYVDKVGVIPSLDGLSNVVAHVKWMAVFELDGEKSVVPGEAFLNAPDPANFLAIDALSDQQVLDWAIASHGGQAFLDAITAHQTEQLELVKRRKAVVPWTTPLLDPKPWDEAYATQTPPAVA